MTDQITPRRARLYHALEPDDATIGNWTARCNVVNQEEFLSSLAAQAEQSIEVVAERLEISVDEVEAALSGKMDLTMTEIRLLGIASDVVITYQVRSARSEYRGWFAALKSWHHADRGVEAGRGSEHAHSGLNPAEYGRRVIRTAP